MRLHKGPGTLSSTLAPRCWRQSTRLVLLGQLLLFLGGIFTWGGLPAWADWVWKLELLAWDPSRGFWLVFLSRLCFPVAMLLSSVSLAGAALLPGVLLCRGAAAAAADPMGGGHVLFPRPPAPRRCRAGGRLDWGGGRVFPGLCGGACLCTSGANGDTGFGVVGLIIYEFERKGGLQCQTHLAMRRFPRI